MIERFLSYFRSVLSEGTADSMARLIFFIVGITTCAVFLVALSYSLWSHKHGGDYDLPRNLSDALRDVFVASGAGKVAQRIWGESPQSPSSQLPTS
jgi:hypothetical protein